MPGAKGECGCGKTGETGKTGKTGKIQLQDLRKRFKGNNVQRGVGVAVGRRHG
jgi:hypothetical protein